jgi:glycosyltransferase involved in cell wall biosynthesis
MMPSVIILTFNSQDTLATTLAFAQQVTNDIHVVDSFSSDRTMEIATQYGAQVTQHIFENYGAQRNWAINSLSVKHKWQLHLDADERMTPALISSILALPEDSPESGFFIPRYLQFLGRELRHGGMSPTWHLRLFRSGVGYCEHRLYDQHFYLREGQASKLKEHMIDDIRMSLSEWTIRHNRWSDAEINEQTSESKDGLIRPSLLGNVVQRKRYLRSLYEEAPLFVRPFLLFFYRYVLRLGFCDGVEGFIFWVLQTFWFHFLIDAKLFEKRQLAPEKY